MTGHRLPRAAFTAAFTVVVLAGGCTAGDAPEPTAQLVDSGVTVTAVLTTGPDGQRRIEATFAPQQAGYHLYSVDLPPEGVAGLGFPTSVTVRGDLRPEARPTADQPVRKLRLEGLDIDLPVYPDGPVTLTLPVVQTGDQRAEVVVGYAACSERNCLPPVVDRSLPLDLS